MWFKLMAVIKWKEQKLKIDLLHIKKKHDGHMDEDMFVDEQPEQQE